MIEYNRRSAVAYARIWAYKRNPLYFDYSALGGDCTNFVSQCLVAGGMPMNVGLLGWYYNSPSRHSASFTGVQFLYDFLTQTQPRRGPVAHEVSGAQLLYAGDIIQLSFDGNTFVHSVLVVEPRAENPLVAAHSFDVFGKPLLDYSFVRARYLHIVGGVI